MLHFASRNILILGLIFIILQGCTITPSVTCTDTQYNSDGSCVPCTEIAAHCATSTSKCYSQSAVQTCTACSETFFLNTQTNTCSSCLLPSNCESPASGACVNTSELPCATCRSAFALNNSRCVACSAQPNCQSYQANTCNCTACTSPGFQISNNACVTCTAPANSACSSGQYPLCDGVEFSECANCCGEGSYYSANCNTSVYSTPSCTACTACGNGSAPTPGTCDGNKSADAKSCVACSDSGCKTYQTNSCNCSTCKSFYSLNGNNSCEACESEQSADLEEYCSEIPVNYCGLDQCLSCNPGVVKASTGCLPCFSGNSEPHENYYSDGSCYSCTDALGACSGCFYSDSSLVCASCNSDAHWVASISYSSASQYLNYSVSQTCAHCDFVSSTYSDSAYFPLTFPVIQDLNTYCASCEQAEALGSVYFSTTSKDIFQNCAHCAIDSSAAVLYKNFTCTQCLDNYARYPFNASACKFCNYEASSIYATSLPDNAGRCEVCAYYFNWSGCEQCYESNSDLLCRQTLADCTNYNNDSETCSALGCAYCVSGSTSDCFSASSTSAPCGSSPSTLVCPPGTEASSGKCTNSTPPLPNDFVVDYNNQTTETYSGNPSFSATLNQSSLCPESSPFMNALTAAVFSSDREYDTSLHARCSGIDQNFNFTSSSDAPSGITSGYSPVETTTLNCPSEQVWVGTRAGPTYYGQSIIDININQGLCMDIADVANDKSLSCNCSWPNSSLTAARIDDGSKCASYYYYDCCPSGHLAIGLKGYAPSANIAKFGLICAPLSLVQ